MAKLRLRIETIVLAVGLVAMVAVNVLVEALRFGGVTAGEVADEVFTWFAPAGYAFGIWIVIFAALALWAFRLARDPWHRPKVLGLPVGVECGLFLIACVLDILWVCLWHLRVFAGAPIVSLALLIDVIALYVACRKRSNDRLDWEPLALFASWLAVAAIIDIAHLATRSATADAGIIPAATTIAIMVLLVIASYLVMRIFDDPVFGLVVTWTGIGVGVRLLPVSAAVGAIVLVLAVVGVAAALIPWKSLLGRRQASTPARATRRGGARRR